MAEEKETKPVNTTTVVAVKEAAHTFTIQHTLLIGDKAYHKGDEAKLLADKEDIGPRVLAQLLRDRAIIGEIPGIRYATESNNQPTTVQR